MKNTSILFTANTDLAAPILNDIEETDIQLLHQPLEQFRFEISEQGHRMINDYLDEVAFVIYGNLRNARYFVQWLQEYELSEHFRQYVHLAADQTTADFLEEHQMAAVMPKDNAQPIDLLEFVLRLSYEGTALYPTTDQKSEELPGFFNELEMPVLEFPVCKEVPLKEQKLQAFREAVYQAKPGAVLFHNRSSVIRLTTAFPGLDFQSLTCISGSPGVTKKLYEEGITADLEADGTWKSMLKLLLESKI